MSICTVSVYPKLFVIFSTDNIQPQISILLLAAGGSSRLGTPKQLLPYKSKTLLQHAIETALASGAEKLTLVLGSYAEEIKKQIHIRQQIEIVENSNWQLGIASSIKTGVERILSSQPSTNAIILMVCDQPFVTPALLQQLMENYHNSGKKIAACSYAGTVGTPVLFDKKYFPGLLNLAGDTGAKKIIHQNMEDAAVVYFEAGEKDIDTESDYESL